MSSSRLPGKMLLPVAGRPLIKLCLERAMRDSPYDVVVVTSTDQSDDPLVSVLNEAGFNCYRGPLEDVLSRFIGATNHMNEDDLIVRLTGDNPAVDSSFIASILADHRKSKSAYTRSLSPFDGLPYGISAEVIQVGLLRRLNDQNCSSFEREHVTIHYTNAGKYHLFRSPLSQDLSHLRMTIDTQDDYVRMTKLFNSEPDAVAVPWYSLANKLSKKTDAFRTPYKQNGLRAQSILALGTAQLGLAYGISNTAGQPDAGEAKKILMTAIEHCITWIDTAAAYGTSEQVIGHTLDEVQKQNATIVTKLSPDAFTPELAQESVRKSLNKLGLAVLPCLLLHRWEQRDSDAWAAIKATQQEGLIQMLGASVQTPEEGIAALQDDEIKFIQIPYNICDRRWHSFIVARRERPDLHLQARSALLQGALTLSPEQWPLENSLAHKTVEILSGLVADYQRESVADLCYAYVRAQDWIDSIVVGVETEQQLLDNLRLFNTPILKDAEEIRERLPLFDEDFLNPALWLKR